MDISDKNKIITSRNEDFSQWYQDVVNMAELAEHGPVKGTMIIKPYGYALWEAIQKDLDARIKVTGVENAYFPSLIPEQFLKKEESHVEGFSPEVAVVTFAGGKKLHEALIVRPTSETIIYDAFSRWIVSHRDLPVLINQWCNVLRWEIRPRLFLRTTEFLWQEGHTAHRDVFEADERAKMMLQVYKDFSEKFLAIPVIAGRKTDTEKFAGAHITYTIEARMQDGKALQLATSHNLGTNFAKVFDLSYTDVDGTTQLCGQTSWGLSTRTIGGLVMVHGDDSGLKLPPSLAPIQLIIVPIWPNEASKFKVTTFVEELAVTLQEFRTKVDYEDSRVGEKFYKWEKKGVPLRLEVGPRDIKDDAVLLVRRDTGQKLKVKLDVLNGTIRNLLVEIQNSMFEMAKKELNHNLITVNSWEEFKEGINNNKFVLAHWSGLAEVENQIKEETGATIRCIPLDSPEEEGKCVRSGEKSTKRVLFAKSY